MPHKLWAARDLFGLGVTAAELLVDEEHIGKTIGRGSEKSWDFGGDCTHQIPYLLGGAIAPAHDRVDDDVAFQIEPAATRDT